MRIFSKYHDYYDKALGFGADPNIIYERKEEDITELVKKQIGLKDKLQKIHDDIFDFRMNRINSPELQITSKTIVLFCGKIYFCIGVTYKNEDKSSYHSTTTEFIYTMLMFRRVITYHSKIKLDVNATSGLFDGKKRTLMTMDKRFKLLFDKQGIESEVAKSLHFELDAPIIVINYDLVYVHTKGFSVHKNKCLKSIEFFKIVNPFGAFQELSMFISGVMGGKSPTMIEVSDKDRISKHGFDKFSFRKEKKE